MRILVSPERFYPTMKAQAVAQCMVRGLSRVQPSIECVPYPMASGGIGTTDIAVRIAQGRVRHETIVLANRHAREVKWALLPDGTAIFDAKDVLGNPDGPAVLNKAYTDSRPLGQMVMQISAYAPRQIAIALGDVLACDGGMGFLQLFGVQAYDDTDRELVTGTRQLLKVERLDFSSFRPPSVPLLALTDSGMTWNMRVQQEDFQLDLIHGGLMFAAARFVAALAEHIALPLSEMPCTGVGGGLGMALAFLGSQFQSGAEFLVELGSIQRVLAGVDYIMTGSLRLTRDSRRHAVGVMANIGKHAHIPSIALALELREGYTDLYDEGIGGVYPVLDRPRNVRESHRALASLIEKAAYGAGMWLGNL